MNEFIRNELIKNLEARKSKLTEFELIEEDYFAKKDALVEAEEKLNEFANFNKDTLTAEIEELENYLYPKEIEIDTATPIAEE